MEYRHLGNSGLEVSVLGLGGNMFGSYVDEAATRAILHKAIDLGVNFFDNAKTYAGGASEELMGKALEGRRHEVLIATKAGSRSDVAPNQRGASLKHLTEALDQSLRKLRTDYVDLFQVHFPDANTPVEETMYALDTMVRQGKARYVGCSNHDAWQICEADWIAKANGFTPFVSVQSEYSVLNRELEAGVVPFCQRYGVGIIPYYPLAAGFLTGKYRPGEPPPEDSRAAHSRYWSQWPTDRNYALVASLKEFAEKRGHTPIELALVWLAGRPAVSTIIAGVSKPEQVAANVKALDWNLSEDDLEELDHILAI